MSIEEGIQIRQEPTIKSEEKFYEPSRVPSEIKDMPQFVVFFDEFITLTSQIV